MIKQHKDEIIKLDEKLYKKGTILGDDSKPYWCTYENYRDINLNGIYKLGFEIIDLPKEKLSKLKLTVNKNTSYELDYNSKSNVFFDTNPNPIGLNSSGIVSINISDESNNILYTSPPIYVMPSSVSLSNYKQMVNDLINIKDCLIYDTNLNLYLNVALEYDETSIYKCLTEIEKPLLQIDKSPNVNLTPVTSNLKPYSIKHVTQKTLIDMKIYSYKPKFKSTTYLKNTDIYENQIIKLTLLKLYEKVEFYEATFNKTINSKLEDLNNINREFQDMDSKSYNKLETGFKASINNQIDDLNQIKTKLRWSKILDKLNYLLNLELFQNVKVNYCTWKPTQIFINDINYKKVYYNLTKLDKELNITNSIYSIKKLNLTHTYRIYEYWCFYKMIYILVTEQRWKLENSKDLNYALTEYINSNTSKNDIKAKLNHPLGNWDILNLTIEYNKSKYYSQSDYLKPDYTFKFSLNNNLEQIVYLDAKYRNYDEQGYKVWVYDICNVAVKKYMDKFKDTNNYPIASFIIHTDSNFQYTYWGGTSNKLISDKLNRNGLNIYLNQSNSPEHSFGAFSFLPDNTKNFKIFIKMILEYKLYYYMNLYYDENSALFNYCWNCGETQNIDKQIKITKGNYIKYYYLCNTCKEFWIKTHCDKGNHILIKHLENYHSLNNSKWFVKCPKC